MGEEIMVQSEGIQLSTKEYRYVDIQAHMPYTVPNTQVSLPNGQTCSINPTPPVPAPQDSSTSLDDTHITFILVRSKAGRWRLLRGENADEHQLR